MKKKSILFCINYMHTGGVEKSLLALVSALPREHFDIHIALMQHKGELMDNIPNDVTLHVLEDIEGKWPQLSRPIASAKSPVGIARYIAAKLRGTLIPYYEYVLKGSGGPGRRFDIAVSYQGPSELLDWYVATRVDADVKISWIHFDISRCYFNKRSERMVYPAFNRIFTVSESARDIFRRMLPEHADRCDVFHNIVDPQRVRLAAGEYGVEREEDSTMICTVGRMTRQKAPDVAIEVAAELKKRGFRFCWHWVGADELLDECRREVSRRGLSDCMRFVGLKSNPYPYMAAADVYVQPSRYEGYCITLAEARAFGLPIVCTDFSGSEQVASLANAQIVDSLDPARLADAIMKAAEMPRSTPPACLTDCDIDKLIRL